MPKRMPPTKVTKKQKFWLDALLCVIITLIAFFLRRYKLDQITPGVWGDEITVGKMSEQVVASDRFVPFVEVNFGHPTPLAYLIDWSIQAFGRNLVSLRLASVIFGSLTVGVFYLLLRQFFQRPLALLGTTLLGFSYSHFILSRFAYEMSPAIFFQTLAMLWLYLGYKKEHWGYWLALGLTLGAGLWTYLSFRITAIFFILLTWLAGGKTWSEKIKSSLLVVISAFLVSAPLLWYGWQHPTQFWARAKSLSVFNQGLSGSEVIKELVGASWRTLNMFWYFGDPNLLHNPSSKAMLDLISAGLMLLGLFYLFRQKNKKIAWASVFLFTPVLINDIPVLERIPEFHYYGIGHPSLLRTSGFIPVVYFWITAGLVQSKIWLEKLFNKNPQLVLLPIVIVVGAVSIQNWRWYFQQKTDRYIYQINGQLPLKLVDDFNQNPNQEYALTESLYKDQRINYFTQNPERISQLEIATGEDGQSHFKLPPNQEIIIDAYSYPSLVQGLLTKKITLKGLKMQPMINPWNEVEVVKLRL